MYLPCRTTVFETKCATMTKRMGRNIPSLLYYCATASTFLHIFTINGNNPASLQVEAFSLSSSSIGASTSSSSSSSSGNILILDHLNINHEKGQHEFLKAFYFDFLECAIDPRKEENIKLGRKTLWANIGAHQFHLPEGKPSAQVLEGVVTLLYPDVSLLRNKFAERDPSSIRTVLRGTKFAVNDLFDDDNGSSGGSESFRDGIMVTDPWGSKFKIVQASADESKDERGSQKGGVSLGLGMKDLTIYTPANANMDGIARFYDKVFGATTTVVKGTDDNSSYCVVGVGPSQTLTFQEHPDPDGIASTLLHADLQEEPKAETVEGKKTFYMSNYGPHISMYIRDLRSTYQRAEQLGVTYVNPRFKRRAYNEEEAVDDCMFRCIDIIDPDNIQDGPILKLEHEIRSVVKRDGSKYKSCPFYDIPKGCTI